MRLSNDPRRDLPLSDDAPPLEAWPDGDEPLVIALELPDTAPPERVLLAEDDEAIRRMYRLVLERRGFEVIEAQDGAEALLYAATQPFDVVVTDLNMPRLDGWGLLARLREDVRTRSVPVAVFSCENELREALRAEAVGAQAYISKGTRLELVVQEIGLLCEPVRRIRRAVRRPIAEPLSIGSVGVLPLLRELGGARWSGAVRMEGQGASVEVSFRDGQPVRAEGGSGPYRAEGVRAFNALVAMHWTSGELIPEKWMVTPNLEGTLDSLLGRAVAMANQHAVLDRQQEMVAARRIEVNAALYERYRVIAAEGPRETAELACGRGLTPAEVLRASSRSPIEVEGELFELRRRGLMRTNA